MVALSLSVCLSISLCLGSYDCKEITKPEGKHNAYFSKGQRFKVKEDKYANLGPGCYSPNQASSAALFKNKPLTSKSRRRRNIHVPHDIPSTQKKRKANPRESLESTVPFESLSAQHESEETSMMMSKVKEMEKELSDKEELLLVTMGRCNMLECNITQCQDLQKVHEKESEDLAKSIASLELEQAELSQQLDQSHLDYSQSQHELAQARERMKTNELSITRLVNMVADLDDVLLNNAEQIAHLTNRREKQEKSQKKLKNKVKQLSAVLKTTQKAIEDAHQTIQVNPLSHTHTHTLSLSPQ